MAQKRNSHADGEHHKHPHAAEAGEPSAQQEHEAVFPPTDGATDYFGDVKSSDVVGKVATIAVVGAGVALISTELLPGMLIGVAAAFLPGIGPKMRPFLKATVRAGYSAVRKTREMVAEAGEQIQDIVAEAKHEAPPVATPPETPKQAGSSQHS
jgi:hypothetical protein